MLYYSGEAESTYYLNVHSPKRLLRGSQRQKEKTRNKKVGDAKSSEQMNKWINGGGKAGRMQARKQRKLLALPRRPREPGEKVSLLQVGVQGMSDKYIPDSC